jgi:uncharacterized membrane protein YdjX (TVP38/TMEM64 family)
MSAETTSTSNALVKKLLILALIVAGIAGFYFFDGAQYLSIPRFRSWVEQQPLIAAAAYFIIYVLLCSLPVAAVLTVMGGAVFGLWWGLLLVSFASTLGATLSFVVSRLLLRDWVQARFGTFLKTINDGVEREGAFYLFSVRLIPVFPFFAINLVFGLTPMKAWTFYWVSQIGMLAGTAVYVNFGAQLADIEEFSLSGILTPQIIGALVLLGVFPLALKKIMALIRKRMGKDNLNNESAE